MSGPGEMESGSIYDWCTLPWPLLWRALRTRTRESWLGHCRTHQLSCASAAQFPFIPAAKAMTVETRGPRPGADRAGW